MSDANVSAIRDLLKAIVDASTWEATRDLIVQHAEQLLIDDAALRDLAVWIAEKQQTGDKTNVERLTLYQKILERCGKNGIEETFEQLPALLSLDQLLLAWMNTDTWPQSQTFLQTFSGQLLSDEALALITGWLKEQAQQDEKARHTLLRHRTIMEQARAASIDDAYAELLEPSPLEHALQMLSTELQQAIQAMLEATGPADIVACVQRFPLLLTSEATTPLENILDTLQAQGQERLATYVEERYETLKQIIAGVSLSGEDTQLLIDWMNTETWEESEQMLRSHTDRLLSEQMKAILEALLEGQKEDERETLRRYQRILETAGSRSIDAAYAELHATLAYEAAFNALLRADSPGALQKAVEQYPVVLAEQTRQIFAEIAEQMLQDGKVELARGVQFRLERLKMIR